jgi:hypothetical protein
MKKTITLFAMGLLLSIALPMQAQTKSELQTMYSDYLKAQGFAPTSTEKIISFKAEGRTYLIYISANDPLYFELSFAYFWPIEDAAELYRAYKAASAVNSTTKVAKIYVTEDESNLIIDAGIYLQKPEDFKFHFSRLLSTLQTATNKFRNEMNDE